MSPKCTIGKVLFAAPPPEAPTADADMDGLDTNVFSCVASELAVSNEMLSHTSDNGLI